MSRVNLDVGKFKYWVECSELNFMKILNIHLLWLKLFWKFMSNLPWNKCHHPARIMTSIKYQKFRYNIITPINLTPKRNRKHWILLQKIHDQKVETKIKFQTNFNITYINCPKETSTNHNHSTRSKPFVFFNIYNIWIIKIYS